MRRPVPHHRSPPSTDRHGRPAAGAAAPAEPGRVGWGFIALYMLAYAGASLLFLAPLLVSLALKVNDLVGIDAAPGRLALVTSVGSLLAMVANPLFGRLSDRTTHVGHAAALDAGRPGRRRLGILTVALAPNIAVVLLGWCIAQVFFNALLAAHGRRHARPGPDQPARHRLRNPRPSASLSRPWPAPSWSSCSTRASSPCCWCPARSVASWCCCSPHGSPTGGSTPATSPHGRFGSSCRTFYVNPRPSPDFAWAFASRFLLIIAYAFLVTYQAYYLIEHLGTSEDDVPHQIYLGTLCQSVALVATALVTGKLSDLTGRRKAFVCAAAVVYGAGAVPDRRCRRRQRLPGRHGRQRSRVRHVHGRRPRPGR